ncbi:hypothetical protein [Nocardioides sp.]|uniref:hypothetical protein n=1 Tax=Nocardioides sp. TaxID=35761 RepID=UPI002C4F55A9|nr:hypothetical protein [Nocardioides sp.]HXH79785.1 hypothetical protein [Nocardioides sp.]
MRSALLCRGAALVAASALSITTLGVLSSPAEAHPAGDRAVNAGASWLKGQLTNGLVHNDQFGGFDDYGLSADFAFALKAVGKNADAATIVNAIEPKSESWVSGADFGSPSRVYAGSLAKLVSVAQAAGEDARAFNSVNQVARLEGRVASAGHITGRLEDAGVDSTDPFDADFVNVIGQSFAARALTTAGSPRAVDATTFLLEQQCPEGFFREQLNPDKTSPEQGCVSGAAGSGPSVDTTALTVINLLDTPGVSATTRGLAGAAAEWLKTQQAADGSFSAGGTEGYNANSTGLAGWALDLAGKNAAATKAAAWLRGVQVADLAPCATRLAAENGAIAYKPSILSATRTAGSITAGQRDQFRRATAQALPTLASVPAGTGTLALSAPATAVEKSKVTVTVSGLGAGEPGCVSFGSVSQPVTGTGDNLTVTFDLPAGAAIHTFTLATLAGTQTATTRATLTPVPVPPVPATPEVGSLTVKKVVTARNNRFKVSLTCDDTERCDAKIVVRSARKVTVGDAARARKVLVAKTSYSVAPGTTKRLVLKVRKPARPALAEGRVKVKAVQSAPDADRAVTKFWLRAK